MSPSTKQYGQFLASKKRRFDPCGFHVDLSEINSHLTTGEFAWQGVVVQFALRKGRAALFEDCGLGKTAQQGEWGRIVSERRDGPVLAFAPLAVSVQSNRDLERKFGIPSTLCKSQEDLHDGLNFTNYEKLDKFNPEGLAGIILDESSILKGFDGKTRKALTEFASGIPYRLCCTATPAPNDYMELGNHAEFLGVMTLQEMLATFFVHDGGGDTSKWRLKRHATRDFWKWVCSWAVAIRKPSDLGYPDGNFKLPELRMHQITVPADAAQEGLLFPVEARTLTERRQARKASIDKRVAECAAIANATQNQFVVWCNLNGESEALTDAILGSVEVTGADKEAHKEQAALGFASGEILKMISKPTIFGYGMNFQSCHNVAFVGLSDSYEQFYQAIRRCWRFGQTQPVDCYVITAETEGEVVRNIQRKEKQAAELMEGMVREMKEEMQKEVLGSTAETESLVRMEESSEHWKVVLCDAVEEIKSQPPDSVHYSIFSPPFASLYTYTNSERDMGNCRTHSEFYEHFRFLVAELYRVLMPGRLLSFHCMNLPMTKERDGAIGIWDFRGELIRLFIGSEAKTMADAIRTLGIRSKIAELEGDAKRQIKLEDAARAIAEEMDNHPGPGGFLYHSEVCIWKDPVTAMQRTKALGLLYKQLRKDSAMSRQGIPDYLVTMRKPGINPEPVTKTHEGFPVDLWQRYASPVWMDINPSDTLQKESARDQEDERHICPLQLQVIDRAIELWTNPDDIVMSPFAGIGSEGYVAIQNGRRFLGYELKESYFKQAVANLKTAKAKQTGLFSAS